MTNSQPLTQTQIRRLQPLTKEKILLLGAGREGLSTYQFLRKQFPDLLLTIADANPDFPESDIWKKIFQKDTMLQHLAGPHYLNTLKRFTLIFKTPGIPKTLSPIQEALASGVKLTSNVEWFLRLARGKIIGVTGTKGKSTTSSVIAHIFQANNFPTLLLGNIGTAPLSFVDQTTSKTLTVLEFSAQQLQNLERSPHIAVIQNITSEHLDYFRTTEDYVAAKTALVKYQKKTDFLIYCDEFKTSRYFSTLTPATKYVFGLKPSPERLCYIRGHALYYQHDNREESVLNLRLIKLLGKHNYYNIMPAVIIAKHFGLTNEQIATAIYSFTPLRHRLEYVATVNHVSYYNDSLSTMPAASAAAVKTFAKHPTHLIAGGYERHQDFTGLATAILKSPVRSVILLPANGPRLKQTIIDVATKKKLPLPAFYSAKDLAAAVSLAHPHAKPQDVVLMSPGAASFGQFHDYADRGDQFCQLVRNLL